MKIQIDNEIPEYHRLVTVQTQDDCVHCALDSVLDALKAVGFSEFAVYSAVLDKADELNQEDGDEND